MKYLAILAVLVVIYLVLTREAPVNEVKEAVIQSEAAPLTQGGREPPPAASSAIKQPLDRTQDVLQKVKSRNGDGEF